MEDRWQSSVTFEVFGAMDSNITSATLSNGTEPAEVELGFEWFPWLTEGLLLFVVGAVGLVGNCCSIVIFARYKMTRIQISLTF